MHNDKVTISTHQLFAMFPDQETARTYLKSRLWPNGCRCPVCGMGDRITDRAGGYYRCNQCAEDFTVRTGTIFERSHVPLHKWLYAMYLLVTARKGISSMQLSKEIGITQKSAWFVLHRIREACGPKLEALRGIVEVDETYVGGKEANRHETKRKRLGRGAVGKIAVLGMRERGGRTIAMPVEDVNTANLHRAIHTHIEAGSTLHTDEHAAYKGLNGLFFNSESVNHSAGEYVRDGVTTNGIESVWAVLKRGLHGVYHHASAKHLGRYVNEFAFRLNEGNVKTRTMARLDAMIAATRNKRITYKELIAWPSRSSRRCWTRWLKPSCHTASRPARKRRRSGNGNGALNGSHLYKSHMKAGALTHTGISKVARYKYTAMQLNAINKGVRHKLQLAGTE